jgi:hypothetical protein
MRGRDLELTLEHILHRRVAPTPLQIRSGKLNPEPQFFQVNVSWNGWKWVII